VDTNTLPGAWALPRPWVIRPAGGVNNTSAYVDTPGGSYVLRVYRNTADPERVGYEHALLRALQRVGLSFAVPCPVATPAGETAVPVPPDGPGSRPALAALFPLLPGERPDAGDPAQVRAAGAALGELDGALARVAVAPGRTSPPVVTLLQHPPGAPGDADPLQLDGLPLAPGQRAGLDALAGRLRETVPPLYGALPRQVIHWDFEPSNVLVAGGRVTAVLDFEFAAPDLRAIDLARGLHAWTRGALADGTAWEAIEAFAGGYRTRAPLAPGEAGAVAPLLLLSQLAIFVHWANRYRRGMLPAGAPADPVAGWASHVLRLGGWLAAHEAELAGRLAAAG
jgi:homoserine kinase type II